MYMHLTPESKKNTKSRRVRNMNKRMSTTQLLLSNSNIKHTSEKAVITFYTFDRKKSILNRKLFYLNRLLQKLTSNIVGTYDKKLLNNIMLNKINKRRKADIRNKKKANYSKSSNKFLFKRLSRKSLYKKYKVNFTMLPSLMYNWFIIKKDFLYYSFMYKFYKEILSYFNIKVYITPSQNKRDKKRKSLLSRKKIRRSKRIVEYKTLVITTKNNTMVKGYTKCFRFIVRKGSYNINLRYINSILKEYVLNIVSYYKKRQSHNFIIENTLDTLFIRFKKKYLKKHLYRHLFKLRLTYRYLYQLWINKAKHNELIVGLKGLISNIYSKNIELNIVNLKYLQLNSDILTEALSIKLRKRKSRLLRLLKKVVRLTKIPRVNIRNISKIRPIEKTLINSIEPVKTNDITMVMKLQSLFGNIRKNYTGLQDNVNNVINYLYPIKSVSVVSKIKNRLHINNMLNLVKYKWITGIRLEAKGRLTKRFTASRGVFKYKYKGNLKNFDQWYLPVSNVKPVKAMMLRNITKPNVQYSFIGNKKHVGAYGIKGWVNNN